MYDMTVAAGVGGGLTPPTCQFISVKGLMNAYQLKIILTVHILE